jgi:acyl-CoA synthetase (AMP-forming)/AMP-acid ligase II
VSDPAGTGANVLAVLRDVAGRVPGRPALVMGKGRRISFARLWDRIGRASAGLRQRGIQPGDRAIVMIPMSIDLYVALLALLKIGAVAVFVDPWIGRRQIAAFAAFAEPRAYLGIPRSHLLRWLEPALRKVPLSVTTGQRLAGLPARVTLAELEEAPGDGWIHPAAPDDSALITFTSGSSGEPKGADRTHGFLLAQHRALAATFPVRNDENAEADMPMFPIFALNNLALGVTSVVPEMDFRRVERVDPGPVLAQMASRDVRTCTAWPRPSAHPAAGCGCGGSSPAALRSPIPSSAPGSATCRTPRSWSPTARPRPSRSPTSRPGSAWRRSATCAPAPPASAPAGRSTASRSG